MSSTELEYCLKRARDEERKAMRCEGSEAAAAHHNMSVRYSARAFLLHADEGGIMPRPEIMRVNAA